MSLRSKLLAGILAIAATALGLGVVASSPVAAAGPVWQTTFRDDFNGSGLPNPANWRLTVGNSYPGGPGAFGTGEIENMTDDPSNVDVRNGHLYITPQRSVSGAWTSARVETNRANFKPPAGGIMHVESRLQMPNVTGAAAKGYWPAFWMLGGPYRQDLWSWPRIGEFDIMENVQGLNWTYNVLHCGTWGGPCNEPEGINNNNGRPNFAGEPCKVTTCQGGFHTYGLEWDRTGPQDVLRWYLDGVVTTTIKQDAVPAQTWADLSTHAGYFVILNVAVGGSFPNKVDLGNGGPFPTTKPGVPMVVDYVEVKYAGGTGQPPTTTTTTTKPTTTTTKPTTTTTTKPTNTTSTPPSTGGPSNLRVSSTTASTITLAWDGPVGTSYDVLRSGQPIALAPDRTFTDKGLLPDTPYLYSIRANNITTLVLTATVGSSPTTTSSSTSAPSTSTAAPIPGTPSNLRVTSTTASTISLRWDGSNSARYDVLRSGVPIAGVTGNTFTDVGLFPKTPYLYSIRGSSGSTPVLTATIA